MQKIMKFSAIGSIALVFFIGCRKETADKDTTAALDNSIADSYFEDMSSVVSNSAADNGMEGLTGQEGSSTGLSGEARMADDCPVVTFSEPPGVFPVTMTVDFGPGCTGYFGVERSGIIQSTFTGPYKDSGTVITIVPDNYYVNGNKVEGIRTVTNMGHNDAGNIYFDVQVSGGKILLADGDSILWESNRQREWTAGSETMAILDDVYSITGSASGTNRDGIPFTDEITEPLIRELDCKWITSGVLEVSPEGYDTRVIDWGDGACDNVITVTIGGFTTTVHLPL